MEGLPGSRNDINDLHSVIQQYEKEGTWVYEQHPFWCTGYTYWDLHSEAPDLFLHLSRSDLVVFKGDLNHRKLTYDCAAPASTPFDVAIGPMANAAGAPRVASLRTIKSDVVVGLGSEEDEVAEKLDQVEPGWKISGKYVRQLHQLGPWLLVLISIFRLLFSYLKVDQVKRSASLKHRPRRAYVLSPIQLHCVRHSILCMRLVSHKKHDQEEIPIGFTLIGCHGKRSRAHSKDMGFIEQ